MKLPRQLSCIVLAMCGIVCHLPTIWAAAAGPPLEGDDEAFLDGLEQAAFGYFWHESGTNGLVRERLSDGKLFFTAAGGFQLAAYCVGAYRGWVERDRAAERVRRALETYASLPRFRGLFARHYDIGTGEVVAANELDEGGDVPATAFLIAGALTARAFFDREEPTEQRIRELATRLYEEVEWDWMLLDDHGRSHPTLARRWSPTRGFAGASRLRSTEDLRFMLAYLLAIGAPRHAIPPACWNEGWAADYPRAPAGGTGLLACPPLCAHQEAHIWIDLRSLQDRHRDYFRNSILAARENRRYGLEVLYPGENLWGFTDCDGPSGPGLYGYPPKRGRVDEDAIVVPAAVAGALPFTPYESLSTLRDIYRRYSDQLWGPYGLYEAFSPKLGWFSHDYTARQQGILLAMIENHRSGLIWKYFMRNECIPNALQAVGFVTVLDDFEPAPHLPPYNFWENSAHYRHRVVSAVTPVGDHVLEVEYDKAGDPFATLAARPSAGRWAGNRYLRLSLRGLERLRVRLEDDAHRVFDLPEVGRVRAYGDWFHLYFEIPKDIVAGGVSGPRVAFIAQPGEPTARGVFFLDNICLTRVLDLEKPAPVTGLRAAPTRMPGELYLTWDPSGDNGLEGHPFRYHVRYSRKPIVGEEAFSSALPLPAGPIGFLPGSATGLFVTGLAPGETIYFAVRAEDLACNLSESLSSLSYTLPRTPRPAAFLVDGFDRVPSPVSWSSSSPRVKIERSETFSLQGPGALRLDYDKKGEEDRWAYVAADLDFRDLSNYRYLTVWVYGQARVLARLWEREDRQEDLSIQTAGLPEGWSPLAFDLSNLKVVDPRAVARILLFIEPGATDTTGTLFLDTIELSSQPR